MRIILRLTFLLCAAVAVLIWAPSHVVGEISGSSLVVSEEVTLAAGHSPYLLSSIWVKPGGRLVLGAGTTILMQAGSRVIIEGKLDIEGTKDDPVLIAGRGGRWEALILEAGAPPIGMGYLQLRDFVGPIQFKNYNPEISHLRLVNGAHNSLYVGELDASYGALHISDISFGSQQPDNFPSESWLSVRGQYENTVVVDRPAFYDSRSVEEIPWDSMGISIEGKAVPSVIIDALFPHSCRQGMPEWASIDRMLLRADLDSCNDKIIPTIFVPGYGTSVNLGVLTHPLDKGQGTLDGWRFFQMLTPAYYGLKDAYTQAHIPYEIAYYDWRLPAKDIARIYLVPLIDKVKKAYHVDSVNLVAHSFGGIVSRSYIQSNSYRGDVRALVEVATPNQGAAKAYRVWEGGSLPEDWSVLYDLVRVYQLIFNRLTKSVVEVIREFFPSAQELLPIYPSLYRDESYLDPTDLFYSNPTLLALRNGLSGLLGRVRVLVIASQSEITEETIALMEARPGAEEWPDGEPLTAQTSRLRVGDGTVPLQSVELPGVESQLFKGKHADLPASAAGSILKYLYPEQMVDAQDSGLVNLEKGVSLYVDCPVEVTVTLPDGRTRSSLESDSEENGEQVGEVETNEDLTWMVLPRQEGVYTINITAEADTPVRWWIEGGDLHLYELKEGESASAEFILPKEVTDEAESRPSSFSSISFDPVAGLVASPTPTIQLTPQAPYPSVGRKKTILPQSPSESLNDHQYHYLVSDPVQAQEDPGKPMASERAVQGAVLLLLGLILAGLGWYQGMQLLRCHAGESMRV